MESKLDLIDSKIGYILEGGGGSCLCTTELDNATLAAMSNELSSGSYILCEDIYAQINIIESNVTLDLNGYTINAPALQNGIALDNYLENITIKNGAIAGETNSTNGILIEKNCHVIKIEDVCIRDFDEVGIYFFLNCEACLIKNCIIENCDNGVFANALYRSSFDNVEVTVASFAFSLSHSSHNCFNECKARNISFAGFYISGDLSNNNTFTHCIAKNILIHGFDINSNATKLINCIISNIGNDLTTVPTEAHGISVGKYLSSSEIKIIDCIIKNIGSENVADSYGIHFGNEASYTVTKSAIENNNIGIIKGQNAYGIKFENESNNNIIINNTIYDVIAQEDASGNFFGRGIDLVDSIDPDTKVAINNVVDNNLIANIFPISDGMTTFGSAVYADEEQNLISRNISYNNDISEPSPMAPSFWNLASDDVMENVHGIFDTPDNNFNVWYTSQP